ncbi:hypothetical protein D3C76_1556800 [compost metagenome]
MFLDLWLLFARKVQGSPLACVTEQAAAFVKVTGAEGLQRVFDGQGLQQLFATVELVAVFGAGQSPTAGKVIA